MRGANFVLAGLIALGGLGLGPAARAEAATSYGVWANPKDSVHVEIKPCGGAVCGFVVQATANAIADARKGGTPNLIGLQLFRDFVQVEGGAWRGRVFVPDLNRTFTGTVVLVDARTMRAKGCLLPNLLCKTQIWKRIDG